MTESIPVCPHCGAELKKWETPAESNWESPFLFVCFSDDCPYYVKGWDWMRSKYKQNTSYRYRIDPVTGDKGPLPVWSPQALRDGIIEEDLHERD